jgi:hypothetical protein
MTDEQIQYLARRLDRRLGYGAVRLASWIREDLAGMPEDPELRKTLQDAAKALQDARARIQELEAAFAALDAAADELRVREQ